MKKLVLFTLEFPYGNTETFLENEIKYLSRVFDTIAIVPSSLANNDSRKIPNNCRVYTSVAALDHTYNPINLIKYYRYLVQVYFFSIIHSDKRLHYVKYFKSLFHYFYNDISKKDAISELIAEHNWSDALFYDYWMLNDGISLCFLLNDGTINHLICRSHGFDLYDEVHIEKIVPFKEFKLQHFQKIYTISLHGKNYLSRQINNPKLEEKLLTRYLGVQGETPPPPSNEKIVVSCSSLIKLKQVDRIAIALSNVMLPFRWVHFGDGPELHNILEITARFPEHIKVEFPGFIKNEKVLEFYIENHVDLFISLSKSEGIPVSMMEAQSFGVPIIAPSVNGIPEIVNEKTGILLEFDMNLTAVSEKIELILSKKLSFDRKTIKEFQLQNFSAEKNYRNFANEIVQLIEPKLPKNSSTT